MKVMVLEPLNLLSGEIPAGRVIDVPLVVVEKLKGKVEPLDVTPEIVETARLLEIDATDENIRALKTFLATQRALAEGRVPDGWTSRAHCHGCRAAVPVWPGCPPEVQGCPWCHRRRYGGGDIS